MRDRLPTPGKENRVKITQDDGTVVEGVLSYADDATQEGSPYTKGNVLPDEVCNAYALDTNTAEPKDAFLAVPGIMGKALLSITVYKVNGTPYPGVVIGGLTGIDTPRRTTNSNGNVTLYVDAGTYNLTFTPSPVCVDTSIPNKQVTVAAGGTGTVTTTENSNGLTSLTITSSRTVAFSANAQNLDAFLVGGGGAGGGCNYQGGSDEIGGAGGGGGRTLTQINVSFSRYTAYSATVGSGGSGRNGLGGLSGGRTSVFGLNASGGNGGGAGTIANGGNGGSGGGGYVAHGTSYSGSMDGGTNGSDGGTITNHRDETGYGGSGQGTTTREWGDPSGTLYSGGGGGGTSNRKSGGQGGEGGGGRGGRWKGSGSADEHPEPGEANTGGGGGGAGKPVLNNDALPGADGGSGIIKLRWVNAS